MLSALYTEGDPWLRRAQFINSFTHLNLLLLNHTYDHVLLAVATCFGQVLEPLLAPVALVRDIYPPLNRLTLCALTVCALIHPIKALLSDNFDTDAAFHVNVKVLVAIVTSDLLEAFNALLNHALDRSYFENEALKGHE
jgi:hypothetical protein